MSRKIFTNCGDLLLIRVFSWGNRRKTFWLRRRFWRPGGRPAGRGRARTLRANGPLADAAEGAKRNEPAHGSGHPRIVGRRSGAWPLVGGVGQGARSAKSRPPPTGRPRACWGTLGSRSGGDAPPAAAGFAFHRRGAHGGFAARASTGAAASKGQTPCRPTGNHTGIAW